MRRRFGKDEDEPLLVRELGGVASKSLGGGGLRLRSVAFSKEAKTIKSQQ